MMVGFIGRCGLGVFDASGMRRSPTTLLIVVSRGARPTARRTGAWWSSTRWMRTGRGSRCGSKWIPRASMTRETSSALAAAVTSTRFAAPKWSFDAWWSMFTSFGRDGRANFARSTEPKSTVTTRSTSSGGGSWVKRSLPWRNRCCSGTGSAQCHDTCLPSDSRPSPRASADPMVSGSGSRCETSAIRRAPCSAARTSFIVPRARAPREAAPRSERPARPNGRGRT